MARLPILMAGLLLAGFGILGSGLVALTYEGTAERIAQNQREALLHEIRALVPPDTVDNDMLADTLTLHAPAQLGSAATTAYRGRRNGQPVAVVLSPVDVPGYGGPIRLIIAIRSDGTLGGVRVLSQKETPGLGDKIMLDKTDWVLGFTGTSLGKPPPNRWKVKRDGGDFDQFTGATVTPRAVVGAVKRTLEYFQANRKALFAAPAPEHAQAAAQTKEST